MDFCSIRLVIAATLPDFCELWVGSSLGKTGPHELRSSYNLGFYNERCVPYSMSTSSILSVLAGLTPDELHHPEILDGLLLRQIRRRTTIGDRRVGLFFEERPYPHSRSGWVSSAYLCSICICRLRNATKNVCHLTTR